MQFTAVRNSSYAPVVISDVVQEFTIVWKVTIETARGITNTTDGITSPPPPGSTGFDT
jgi:hypothetical protein